jgi:hypothetical protein
MSTTVLPPPEETELDSALGDAATLWDYVLASLETRFTPLDREWKKTQTGFGRTCVVRHKKRALVSLTPKRNEIVVGLVLSERGVALALQSTLVPPAIKEIIAESPRYTEGRSVRFLIHSPADAPVITALVQIKASTA